MITIDEVKIYGNLPKGFNIQRLAMFIASAKREVRHILTESCYNEIVADNKHKHYETLQECLMCQTLIFALPTANTFFIEGMKNLNADGVNSRFFSPEETSAAVAVHENRLKILINRIKGNIKKNGFSFKIIGGRR